MKKLKTLSDGNVLYQNHRDEPYFTYLKEGKKTVEGRICKGFYGEVIPGDYIEVQRRDSTDAVLVKVTGLRAYRSFEELLTNEEIQSVLPDVGSVAEGVAVYEKFYTKEQQETYGVVALEVKLVTNM